MELGGWLRSLGLEQYKATFRENAIDAEVLPDLTDQDLEKLGVLLGHRRKLLRANSRDPAATWHSMPSASRQQGFGSVVDVIANDATIQNSDCHMTVIATAAI
jgi:hypothetical protein